MPLPPRAVRSPPTGSTDRPTSIRIAVILLSGQGVVKDRGIRRMSPWSGRTVPRHARAACAGAHRSWVTAPTCSAN